MAKSSIKVRAKVKSGEAKVKCLISHPMETGLRKDKKNW
jgi:sulfur-oxidizing protein SoxZ